MDDNRALRGAETTIPLRASHSAHLDLVRARAALVDLDWLGPEQAGAAVGTSSLRRVSIAADLLPIKDGSATAPIRKAALIDIGIPTVVGDAVVVEVSWQSATLAPLFPVFAGRLHILEAGLYLDGRYVPPFGRIGLVIDEGLLGFIARRTAQAFLARLAAHLAE